MDRERKWESSFGILNVNAKGNRIGFQGNKEGKITHSQMFERTFYGVAIKLIISVGQRLVICGMFVCCRHL